MPWRSAKLRAFWYWSRCVAPRSGGTSSVYSRPQVRQETPRTVEPGSTLSIQLEDWQSRHRMYIDTPDAGTHGGPRRPASGDQVAAPQKI